MAIAYVNSAKAQNNTTSTGNATANTTGADFIAYILWDYTQSATATVTDSLGNTYTGIAPVNDGISGRATMAYKAGATVGSSHSLSADSGGTASYPTIVFGAFSGVNASPLDKSSEGHTDFSNQTSIGCPSQLPSEDNELLVIGGGDNMATSATLDVGTIVQQGALNGGVSFAGFLAYEIQTTATARTATWSFASNGYCITVLGTFKQAVAAATGATNDGYTILFN